MQTLLIVLSIAAIILLAAVMAVLFVVLKRTKKSADSGKDDKTVEMLSQNIRDMENRLNVSQKDMRQEISSSYKDSAQIIKDVTHELEGLKSTNKQVVGFADQLQSLQDILKNPKQRGILGEYYLETVLKNVLPPSAYKMQYTFKDGEIVDAAVFIKDKIVPIDSKFSLENYNKIIESKDKEYREQLEKQFKNDLKNRIDETAKYIRPGEGTMDFAFMFIPSEGIYYDLLVNQIGGTKVNTRDLIEYAFKERKVIIVSPTSFFAYLQTVMQGLRAMQIEESAIEIKKHVEKLSKHLLSYEEFMKKMGNNLGTTVNMYNKAYKEFQKIDKDVVKITDGENSVDPIEVEKPTLE